MALVLIGCQAQPKKNPKSSQMLDFYTTGIASRDGIGKFYQGREISHVMGHQGAAWLERPEREAEENTSQMIKNFEFQPDDVVADIGAGTGYHTFRIAPLLTEGRVIAVDIQIEMLSYIRARKEKEGIENVDVVLGTERSPNLKPNSVDIVFFVDVYHEVAYPREMMQVIVEALKPGGRVVLVEYRLEDPTVPIKPLHKMTEAQAEKEMKAVGLKLKENKTNLPWQHFMVFVKK